MRVCVRVARVVRLRLKACVYVSCVAFRACVSYVMCVCVCACVCRARVWVYVIVHACVVGVSWGCRVCVCDSGCVCECAGVRVSRVRVCVPPALAPDQPGYRVKSKSPALLQRCPRSSQSPNCHYSLRPLSFRSRCVAGPRLPLELSRPWGAQLPRGTAQIIMSTG